MNKKYEIAFFLCFVFVGGVMMIVGQTWMWRGTSVEWESTSWFTGHLITRYTGEFYVGQWLFTLGIPLVGCGLIGALAVGASRLIDKVKG